MTTARDYGRGSLREGAEAGAKWIVFDGDFEITLSRGLDIAGDTTIDGRGRRITIHGGVYIQSSNVIVTNVVMSNFEGSSALDGIGVHGVGVTNVWLDHISFDVAPDQLLPLFGWPDGSYAPGSVTVTWSRFGRKNAPSSPHSESHAILIGSQGKDGVGSSRTRVTLAFNLFETDSRSPSVADGGRVHAYNNLWTRWSTSAIDVKRNGQVFSENNIFAEGSSALDRAFAVDGSWRFGGEALRDEGSWFPTGASGVEENRDAIFAVPYWYSTLPADDGLMLMIQGGAGATLR